MAERQEHGLINENNLKIQYGLNDYLNKKDYTAKYDAETSLGHPVSIKTIKHKNSIDLGDYFRNANADKDFYLIVSFWSGQKHNLIEEYHLHIPHVEWKELFKREFDERIRTMISEASNDRSYDKIWREQRISLKQDWGDGIIKLRPKRDHKTQKRMQCSISYKDFLELHDKYKTNDIRNNLSKGTTKSGGQKDVLDKFYTKPEIAKSFIDKTNIDAYDVVIEPSAGSGAFSNQIPGCFAYDLKPEGPGIVEQDWLEYSHNSTNQSVLVVGNPPFGQQNSLATKFINHSASFANRIAFILPVSFKKDSVQNRLNPYLHLIYQEDLQPNSFTFNGEDYDVKCVFQIWDIRDHKREAVKDISNDILDYVKKTDGPDLAIQRVGGNAGSATKEWQDRSEASNNFVKIKIDTPIDDVLVILNGISYPTKDMAIGPRSISKNEFNLEINKAFAHIIDK